MGCFERETGLARRGWRCPKIAIEERRQGQVPNAGGKALEELAAGGRECGFHRMVSMGGCALFGSVVCGLWSVVCGLWG